ncbi:hypothetical protein [Gallaecimonas mangrovi]|uniref:hypothetical protein n=1 Tax=Gallaecimonas mangrovi TaxID=2291597 RepID=UPI000E205200|nr:hypothetical protein [Gallaecimonas mangrovi]
MKRCQDEKSLLAMLWLPFFCGCAVKSEVLIYPVATSAPYLSQTLNALHKKGFKTTVLHGSVPTATSQTVLVAGPGKDAEHDIAPLRQVLAKLGQPLVLVYHRHLGNHFYSPKHIGLYLFEPDSTTKSAPALTGYRYHSRDCSGQYVLTLANNGHWQLSGQFPAPIRGDWQQQGEALTLFYDDKTIRFTFSRQLFISSQQQEVTLKETANTLSAWPERCQFYLRQALSN